jgi:hypothetical protein
LFQNNGRFSETAKASAGHRLEYVHEVPPLQEKPLIGNFFLLDKEYG